MSKGGGRRYEELKAMLMERRREVASEVQKKVRESRNQSVRRRQGYGSESVLEILESSDFGVQEDIELALIETKADTLAKINDALARLEQGRYGNCDECGQEIAEKRLRALPFAIRCKDCEEAREVAEKREREIALRRGSAARMLFVDDDERI